MSEDRMERKVCGDCNNPRWATCPCTVLDTAAMREDFVGFPPFVLPDRFLEVPHE